MTARRIPKFQQQELFKSPRAVVLYTPPPLEAYELAVTDGEGAVTMAYFTDQYLIRCVRDTLRYWESSIPTEAEVEETVMAMVKTQPIRVEVH
jgi:hypothetical protein